MRMNIGKISDLLSDRGIEVSRDRDMAEIVSFRAGGKADLYIEPEGEAQLAAALEILDENGCPVYIMGNGTNILVRDGGYRGCIIRLGGGFSRIDAEGETLVCGAGALLSVIARTALNQGLTGFEFASGIPGSIGGAVYMNAGAYGGEIRDCLASVRLLNRDTLRISEAGAEELGLGYRSSRLQESGEIALSVRLSLSEGNREDISSLMRDLTARRNEKQPVQYPSAGSFFKRPPGYFAGKLIQDAGLKGLRVGEAQVSELHSGFIINLGGASAEDITELMVLVQNTVMDRFGVLLEPEVRIIGDD